MDEVGNQLKRFHVSYTTGFLLKEPLTKLPEYFEPWNFAAKEMPKLVQEKRMREVVAKMEILDHQRLSTYKEYRLAHLQLSLIASGYIWQEGDRGVPHILPECVAVPWWGVAEYLGIKPVISHCSLALANWERSTENNCLECLYSLPGGRDADWFIIVTVQVEMDFAQCLPHVILAMKHSEEGNVDSLIENLTFMAETVHRMKGSLSTMHERLSARTFYNIVRPFLSGWGDNSSPLPKGLIYEGVSETYQKMKGASAAQSSSLHCMDALLGVSHSEDTLGFLNEMREYMPPSHRDFIEWIKNRSKIKSFVQSQSNDKLSAAYNSCVKSVVDFRSYHIQIVTKYIVMMANESNRSKEFESLAAKGTGGSDLLPFLKTLRSSTSDCLTYNTEETNKENADQISSKMPT